jgi:F-box domain
MASLTSPRMASLTSPLMDSMTSPLMDSVASPRMDRALSFRANDHDVRHAEISPSAELRLIDLPVEMLRMIFSNFPDTYRHQEMASRPPIFDCSDIINIRSTCSKFRNICLGVPFWTDEKFTFTDIIPERRKWKTNDTYDDYDVGFLRLLFRDRLLVEAISKRTHWRFKNLASLLAVLQVVPSFPSTWTHLALLFHSNSSNPWDDQHHPRHGDWQQSSVNGAIASLAVCPSLTSLELRPHFTKETRGQVLNLDLNLGLIVAKFPSIKRLRIRYPSRLTGSLAKLKNLESMLIDGSRSIIHGGYISLPFKSTKSLTHMSILCFGQGFCCNVDCANKAFNEFVNLTSLFVRPLTKEMCDVLLRSRKIKLNDFRATLIGTHRSTDINYSFIDHELFNKVIRLLSASSSLRSVKTLRLAFGHDYNRTQTDQFLPYFARIAEAITTNHYEIESLVLGIGINTDWFAKFARLTSLKTLVWYVSSTYFQDRRMTNILGTSGIDADLLHNIAVDCKNTFDGVFQGLVEKPLVDLIVLGTSSHPVVLDTGDTVLDRCVEFPWLYGDDLYGPVDPPWKNMDYFRLV